MRTLVEYINEKYEEQLNESLIMGALVCLCGAAALHFGVKLTKKVANGCNNFWGWALGEKEMSMQNASESLNEDKKEKFDKSKVQPMMIPSDDILEKVIEISEPKGGKNKKGFYYFQELLKNEPDLKKLNKAPYFANYVSFMDAGSKDKPEVKPNFYGLLGFSLKFWAIQAKKAKDEEIKSFAKEHANFLHIFAVQTDPKFAKLGLFDVYIENMKKACKEANMEGITIKCDDEDLQKVYAKYGFSISESNKDYMLLTLNKKEEK